MFSKRPARIGAEAATTGPLGFLVGNQRHGAIEPDGEYIISCFEIGVSLGMLHIGAESTDTGQDRFAVFRVLADFARQREQSKCAIEVKFFGIEPLGQAGAFWFFAIRASPSWM